MMSKTLERREKLREDLIAAAERAIAAKGLAGLKSRDLAQEIGCSNGAVFNLVDSMDELVLRVGSRTLARLDVALATANDTVRPPDEALVRIAMAYCDFAAQNIELWRTLFEHRMELGREIPQWAIDDQMHLFRHIHGPLAALFPDLSHAELGIRTRSLFSAVHGMVALGLEQKLIAVPAAALRSEIATIVRAILGGLAHHAKT
jgi:AcrR family transcriptional regulator